MMSIAGPHILAQLSMMRPGNLRTATSWIMRSAQRGLPQPFAAFRLMSTTPKKDINYRVTTEFGSLKSVLVGRADGFRLPAHEHEPLLYERNVHGTYNHVGLPYPDNVIKEANDSLNELCSKLKQWNPDIEIVRSDLTSPRNHTPAAGNRGYSTRDVMVVVKDTLYLCPSLHRSRRTEAEDCFQHVIDSFSKRGKVVDLRTARWNALCEATDNNLRAKSPEIERQFLANLRERAKQLDKSSGPASFIRNDDPSAPGRFATITSSDYFQDKLPTENNLQITEEVPIFDAANILVVNDRQLLYLTSISGNFHGLVHLKEYMKKHHDMEVVPMTGVYSGLHIDSTICILNKEKVLYCAERINLESVHNILKNCGYTDKAGYIPVSV